MKRKWFILMMASIAILWVAIFVGAKWVQRNLNRDHTSADQAAHDPASDLKVYWDAPDFSFPDQDGKWVTKADLLGHVWIADFFYSQCTTACPVLTSKLMLLEKQITQPDVRFISFSVDPEHDTPRRLKAYANEWQGDQNRWRLLSTNAADLAKVAGGMKVTVAPTGNEINPIMHSNLFMLVDEKGQVRGLYDSADNDALHRLRQDVITLAGPEVPAPTTTLSKGSTADRGHILFGSMGCVACHGGPTIAPALQNIFGSKVQLDDHRWIWADEAYLHESIIDPTAKIATGYGKTMPSYRSFLNDEQVLDLVEYIKSISTNSPGGHGMTTTAPTTQSSGLELAVDPVCKMEVTADPSAPHADFKGKTYYFCSDHCREQFVAKPDVFAHPTTAP